jgi:hypothetical protein
VIFSFRSTATRKPSQRCDTLRRGTAHSSRQPLQILAPCRRVQEPNARAGGRTGDVAPSDTPTGKNSRARKGAWEQACFDALTRGHVKASAAGIARLPRATQPTDSTNSRQRPGRSTPKLAEAVPPLPAIVNAGVGGWSDAYCSRALRRLGHSRHRRQRRAGYLSSEWPYRPASRRDRRGS